MCVCVLCKKQFRSYYLCIETELVIIWEHMEIFALSICTSYTREGGRKGDKRIGEGYVRLVCAAPKCIISI